MEAGFKARILAALSRISYRLPLHQVANSPVYLGYRGIRAAQWVPPGLDRAIYYRRKAAPVFKKGKPWTVGVIGRREQPKGTKYVLDAFEKLAAMDPHVCLKVAYGNLPDAWAHDRAEVVYPKDDAELAEFYRSIDVLVAPGTVQLGACHYPVLEAMAVGTPVVTTGYLPASGENSWLVPVKDSDAIVSALIELVGCDEGLVQIKLRNAEVAISDFYWEEVALRFLNIMRSV
jgi:glycosyltransferase involved in cell wall biosynthesis